MYYYPKDSERRKRREELYEVISPLERRRISDSQYYIIRTWEQWMRFDEWARLGLSPTAMSRWGPDREELPVAIMYDYVYGDCGPDYVEYDYYTLDGAKELLADAQAMCDTLGTKP